MTDSIMEICSFCNGKGSLGNTIDEQTLNSRFTTCPVCRGEGEVKNEGENK